MDMLENRFLKTRTSILKQIHDEIDQRENDDEDNDKSKYSGSDKIRAYRKQLFHGCWKMW